MFTQTRQLYIIIFTILKESYTSKSTGIVCRVAGHPIHRAVVCGFSAREEPARPRVTRLGCPSLGLRQQVCEDPEGPVLVGIWGKSPRYAHVQVLQASEYNKFH